MRPGSFRKASIIGAFFIGTSTLAATPEICNQPADSWHRVRQVLDGDTIVLADKRKVRFIGINTPETMKEDRPAEPLSGEARELVMRLLGKHDNRVGLIDGTDPRDRYGRLLAHPFLPDGSNLTALLLQAGLGYHIAIPPNLAFLACYQNAEASARRNKHGLWSLNPGPVNVHTLDRLPGGFHYVQGTVTRVGRSRGNLWLNLGTRLAIAIPRKDLVYFDSMDLNDLAGRHVEVRGWVYFRNGEARMKIRHPAMIRLRKVE